MNIYIIATLNYFHGGEPGSFLQNVLSFCNMITIKNCYYFIYTLKFEYSFSWKQNLTALNGLW